MHGQAQNLRFWKAPPKRDGSRVDAAGTVRNKSREGNAWSGKRTGNREDSEAAGPLLEDRSPHAIKQLNWQATTAVPLASIQPDSKRHRNERCGSPVGPRVVIARLRIELPSRIANPNREAHTGVHSTRAGAF